MPTFDAFVDEMKGQLTAKAQSKNYALDLDGPNRLYESVQRMTGDSHAHGCGEIIYKVNRFLSPGARGGDPEDIIKVACWAFLVWKHTTSDPDDGREA